MTNMMVCFNIFASLLTIFVLVHGEDKVAHRNLALDGVKLRLEKVICVCNPKYCTVTTCKVRFRSRQVAYLNWIGMIHKNLTVLNFNLKSYYKFSNNEYRPILMDTTVDFCAGFNGDSSISPLMGIMQATWGNKTNIFQPCPLSPGEYYVKDWNFSASDLPSVIPAGRYYIKSIVRTDFNDFLTNATMYFNVANHGILDLNMG